MRLPVSACDPSADARAADVARALGGAADAAGAGGPALAQAAARLLVSACDPSADAHAADVVRALGGAAAAFGVGGPALAEAGVRLLARGAALSAVGVTEAARVAPAALRAALRVARTAARARPAAALVCDAPALHIPAARALASAGVPVVWYLAPQLWAWGAWRARWLRGAVRRLLCVLPFEEAWFAARGLPARFVGHPLLDRSAPARRPEGGVAAVLPGSRPAEARRHLPVLVEAARLLGLRPLVGVAPGLAPPRGVPHVAGAAAALARAEVALCASGTVVLQAALAGVPAVAIYRLSAASHAIARRLVRVPHVALPNLVLGREAVPERLQDAAAPAAVARAAETALRSDAAAVAMELRDRLGPPGAARRVAAEVAEAMAR